MGDVRDLETLMGYLGDFGKYQSWQFFLHILSATTAGLHMLTLVTVAAVPDHRCVIPDLDLNSTVRNFTVDRMERYIPRLTANEFDSCNIYNVNNESVKCSSWVYDNTYHESSRAIDWDFVCDQRWMGAVAQSAYMFGVFIGAITLGSAADKYGRKIIFCLSAVCQLILGVGVAFVPEYYTFLFVRFLYGIFGSAGSYITGFVLTMELVGPKKRTICGVAFQVAFAFGIMLVAGWGALISNRQCLQIVYGLHSLLLIGHWWLMDESPRWLWSRGRITESVKIIQKALKTNGSPIILNPTDYVSKNLVKARENDNDATLLDLFKTPNLRNRTLNICLSWFANSLVYYGLSLSTGKLNGNPFLMLFLVGIVELPGYIITVFLMDRTGRRPLVSFFMISGGICCVAASLLVQGTFSITIVMLGKLLIASSFAIVYNYSAELFPTVIRNSALGIGSMSARLSGTLTPLVTLLDSLDPSLPAVIFATIAIFSGFLMLFLPETLGTSMPETIKDGEVFGAGDTCFATCFGKQTAFEVETPMEQMEPLKKS